MFLIDDGTPDLFRSLLDLAKLFIERYCAGNWILALYKYIIIIKLILKLCKNCIHMHIIKYLLLLFKSTLYYRYITEEYIIRKEAWCLALCL